jgi:hypothetical protein
MKAALLTSMAGAMVLSGTAQAQLIGNFEGALESGWVLGFNPVTGAPSTAWASVGNYSLAFAPTTPNAFTWSLQFNNLAVAQQLATTHRLALDVHFISSEWTDTGAPGWVRWDQASINSASGGWSQTTDINITDSANPSYPGSWDPLNWGATHSRTLTYDFTGLGNTPAGAWGQFNISVNMGGIEGVGNFYVDNVRLVVVPEPSGAVLFALGGALCGFARRRR